VGDGYPLLAKLNVEDFFADGLTATDGVRAALFLADQGLDGIEVSGGMRDSGDLGPARRNIKELAHEAYFLDNAVAVKETTQLPLFLVGGLRSPELMARIHRETGIDYFSLSRPLIREPGLVNEWANGRTKPAQCISCSGCFLTVKKGGGIYCARIRREQE